MESIMPNPVSIGIAIHTKTYTCKLIGAKQ